MNYLNTQMRSIYTYSKHNPLLALLIALFASFIICLPSFTNLARIPYILMILTASAYLIRNIGLVKHTSRAERFFFGVVLANFGWLAFSVYYNDAHGLGSNFLWGRYFFFLFLIPMFFVFREFRIPSRIILVCLATAALVSILTIIFYVVQEINFRSLHGGINPNKFGPIQLCITGILVCFLPLVHKRKYQSLVLTGILIAFVTVILSRSKATWFAVPVLCAFFIFYIPSKWSIMRRVLILFIALGILCSSYLLPVVNKRVDNLFQNVDSYLQSDHYLDADRKGTFGDRIELWKAAWKIFLEQPITGSGVGTFQAKMKANGEKYQISEHVQQNKYVHSQYFKALVTGGVPGLILLLLILCTPVYIGMSRKARNSETNAARLALIFIGITYLVVNLPDDHFEGRSPVMFLSVLLALLLARISDSKPDTNFASNRDG